MVFTLKFPNKLAAIICLQTVHGQLIFDREVFVYIKASRKRNAFVVKECCTFLKAVGDIGTFHFVINGRKYTNYLTVIQIINAQRTNWDFSESVTVALSIHQFHMMHLLLKDLYLHNIISKPANQTKLSSC